MSQVGLKENDEVEIIATEDVITIRKVKKHQSLESLFAGYTDDYIPHEMNSSAPVGREVLD